MMSPRLVAWQFVAMLFELVTKRAKARAPPPMNPLFGKAVLKTPWAMKTILPTITSSPSDAVLGAAAPPDWQPLTRFNRIYCQIGCRLLLPMAISVIVVLSLVSGLVRTDLDKWMVPVKDAMIEQELTTLDNQAYERAALTSAAFAGYASSIGQVADFFERLYLPNGTHALPLGTPYPSHFSPIDQCKQSSVFDNGGQCTTPPGPENCTTGDRCVRFYSSAWYMPAQPLSTYGNDTAALKPGADMSESATLAEQEAGSQLDNIFRSVYFATGVSDVWAAFESSEVIRQYPYADLSLYADPQKCDAIGGIDTNEPSNELQSYTPLCRPWYRNAANSSSFVINTISADSSNPGQNFVAISLAVRNLSVSSTTTTQNSTSQNSTTPSSTTQNSSDVSSLFGVVAFSVPLVHLTKSIASCLTEQQGEVTAYGTCYRYAFVWDADGYGVLHKNYAARGADGETGGPVLVLDLEAGDDSEFREAFDEGVVSRGRVTGNFSYSWYGVVWYYSFRPVEGTPFMLAITVRESEVVGEADRTIDDLNSKVTTAMVINIVLCVLALVALLCCTNVLNARFARPVNKLRKLSAKWSHVSACVLEHSSQGARGEPRTPGRHLVGDLTHCCTAAGSVRRRAGTWPRGSGHVARAEDDRPKLLQAAHGAPIRQQRLPSRRLHQGARQRPEGAEDDAADWQHARPRGGVQQHSQRGQPQPRHSDGDARRHRSELR